MGWVDTGSKLRSPQRVLDGVDKARPVHHPTGVLALGRRLTVVALALAFSTANVALCAGWQVTAEARMACCAEGVACPMHQSDSSDMTATHVVTQADADSCCAASEGGDGTPSASAFGVTVAFAVVPIMLPAIEAVRSSRPAGWRTSLPAPTDSVPRHLLLSVFLV